MTMLLPLFVVDLELLLQVVGFLVVALGDFALALGPLGGLLGGLFMLLRLTGVHVGLVAVATGLFAEALALQFALGAALARGPYCEYQQDGDDYDYGDDQCG
jgi:phosphotransferase system  glucose/maltose/N-acetylglucosamine-specific IIC component